MLNTIYSFTIFYLVRICNSQFMMAAVAPMFVICGFGLVFRLMMR